MSTTTSRSKKDFSSQIESPPSKRSKLSVVPSKIKVVKTKTKDNWKDKYVWLAIRQISDEDVLFCTWCESEKLANNFTAGSRNLQHSVLSDHLQEPGHTQIPDKFMTSAAKGERIPSQKGHPFPLQE